MSIRRAVALLAGLTLAACVGKGAAPLERLTVQEVTRTYQYAASRPMRPAEGNEFAIVHLVEDPPRGDARRDWLRSTLHDWDGRTYEARSASIHSGKSSGSGLFGRRTETLKPDRVELVFEVPRTATLHKVIVPEPLTLSETPVRVSRLRAVRFVEPRYPEAALRRRIDGLVKLEVFVTAGGTVAGARPVHGPSVLGEAAAAAVRQWKFEPHVVDGKPMPALTEVQVTFRADHPLTNTFAR